jgi:AcrR family transcriptional regulator
VNEPVPGVAGRKRMTGEARKRSIAETTVELIARYGVRGATTARIAAAEGISERALYKYFANRREMLLAAHDCLLERANRSLHEHKRANAIEYLRAAAQLHWPSEQEFAYPLYEFFASSPKEDLRGELKIRHQADLELVKNIVEEGKSQGVIRPDVNSELAAWEFWAVCFTQDLAYMLGFDEFGSSGLSLLMIEHFLDGISVGSSR